MRHRYFTYWRNTLRWGYRLSIKQLLAFMGYSVIAYSFFAGVLAGAVSGRRIYAADGIPHGG